MIGHRAVKVTLGVAWLALAVTWISVLWWAASETATVGARAVRMLAGVGLPLMTVQLLIAYRAWPRDSDSAWRMVAAGFLGAASAVMGLMLLWILIVFGR